MSTKLYLLLIALASVLAVESVPCIENTDLCQYCCIKNEC